MNSPKNTIKYAIMAVGIAFLLAPAGFALAQEKTDLADRKQQLIKEVKERAAQSVQNMEKIREKAQEKTKEQADKLKEKLTEVRDEQKKRQTQQILEQLARNNKVWTEHFTKLLNRYDAILQKIQIRADKAAANERDVSAVTAEIQKAKTAISTARTAVTAQVQKIYAPDVAAIAGGSTSPSSTTDGQEQLIKNLRTQLKTLRDQLFKDLFALRDGAMKDARSAVQSALQTLSKIPSVDEESKTNF